MGIPDAEQKWLSGVTAQYESEAVYHSIREDLEKQGVIFLDMDSGLREYEELVKEWFGSVVPYSDNKFSALNTAVLVRWIIYLRTQGSSCRITRSGIF